MSISLVPLDIHYDSQSMENSTCAILCHHVPPSARKIIKEIFKAIKSLERQTENERTNQQIDKG